MSNHYKFTYRLDTFEKIKTEEEYNELLENSPELLLYTRKFLESFSQYKNEKIQKQEEEKQFIIDNMSQIVDDEIEKRERVALRIYKNKINQSRGMSQKKAKEATGYVLKNMNRYAKTVSGEKVYRYKLSFLTPYCVSYVSYEKVPEFIFDDFVNNEVFPFKHIYCGNDVNHFRFPQEIDYLSEYEYTGANRMFDIDISINNGFYMVSFSVCNCPL